MTLFVKAINDKGCPSLPTKYEIDVQTKPVFCQDGLKRNPGPQNRNPDLKSPNEIELSPLYGWWSVTKLWGMV